MEYMMHEQWMDKSMKLAMVLHLGGVMTYTDYLTQLLGQTAVCMIRPDNNVSEDPKYCYEVYS